MLQKSEMLDRIGRERHDIRQHDAERKREARRNDCQDQGKENHEEATDKAHDNSSLNIRRGRILLTERNDSFQSVIAMARNAMRSRTDNFSVSLLSCPQAARMSRPRGVRTGEE